MKTYEQIRSDILNAINTPINKLEGSIINTMISPIAFELSKGYENIDKLLDMMFSENLFNDMLDDRCLEYGIGRKKGTKATGELTITGTSGTIINKGTLFATVNNKLYETIQEVTIDMPNIIIDVIALEVGTNYNVNVNEIISIPIEINGVTAVTNNKKITGGSDNETDDILRQRLIERKQSPATSGNKEHYKIWAKEVEGINDALVLPLHNGAGTVTVLVVGDDKNIVSQDLLNKTQIYIDNIKPIGALLTVDNPNVITINISCTIIINSAKTIDEIKNKFIKNVDAYIKNTVFKSSFISVALIGSMLIDTEEVLDYSNLLLNNNNQNILLNTIDICTIGEVIFNAN